MSPRGWRYRYRQTFTTRGRGEFGTRLVGITIYVTIHAKEMCWLPVARKFFSDAEFGEVQECQPWRPEELQHFDYDTKLQ